MLFEFAASFLVEIRVSWYMMGLNHTPESKVMAVLNCLALPCLISTISIYYLPESDIRGKSYDRLNLPWASMLNFDCLDILLAWIRHLSQKLWPYEFALCFHVQFQASRYIMGLNWTSKPKFMAIWICLILSCLISSVSIYYWPESDIWAKVMAIWVWLALPCLILSISIYYGPESDFRVKCYDHSNFSRASVVQFWASRYFMGLNHTPKSKVMAFWICRELSCTNSSVSIYDGLNHTPESKFMAIWICLVLPFLISSVSIYYWLESDIRVKSYDLLNLPRAFLFKFESLDILLERNGDPSRKLWSFEFDLRFHV